jgi:hypothetical protein
MWGKRLACLIALAVPAAVSGACRSPTQITIEITTDVKCPDVKGTALTIGHLVELEQLPATTATPACDPSNGRIGSLVIVPSGANDDTVAVRIVMGVGKDVSECKPPAYGPECIVARRALRFIPGASLYVPIAMAASCEGVPCDATQTCVHGDCASATIDDPSRCESAVGCGEDALGPRTPVDAGGKDAANDAGLDGDAGEPPVPLDPVAACGRPSTYVDDFGTSTIAPEWAATGTVTQEGGKLVVTGGARLESRFTVNLADDRLRIEIPTPPAPGVSTVLAARALAGDEIAFVLRDGQLRMHVAGDEIAVPYDPVAHRWWQIVENAGLVRWETSPDAITWTSRRTSVATPAFAPAVRIVLESTAGTSTFARLNAGRPRAPWCKASTLVDDFAAGAPGLRWTPTAQGACTIAETGNTVLTTMSGAGTSYCAFASTTAYDLTASSVYIDVPAITNFYPPVHYFLRVSDASNKSATLAFLGSTNQLEESADGIALQTTAYASATEVFWRLRESGGMLVWETGPSAAAFTVKRQAAAPFKLDAVRVLLGADTNAAMAGQIQIAALGVDTGS